MARTEATAPRQARIHATNQACVSAMAFPVFMRKAKFLQRKMPELF
jgi:hypothetical protein